MSKKQARSNAAEAGLPDWADEVTPDEEVMRKFYAPTGSFKPGPIAIPEPREANTSPAPIEPNGSARDALGAVVEGSSRADQPNALTSTDETTQQVAPHNLPPDASSAQAGVAALPSIEAFPKPAISDVTAGATSHASAPTSAQALTSNATPPALDTILFEDFARKWKRYLYPGQLSVMRALYEITFEQGVSECFTQYSQLAASTKMSRRNCINVMNSLAERGFVERLEVRNDATGKGIRLRVHAEPIR
jgi:DNA-binding MarR family transcriptional regulator